MGLVLPTIEAYQVQHLPIVKAYADKIGVVEVINQLVPTEMGIDPGTIVLGMILDTLSGRSPLYPSLTVARYMILRLFISMCYRWCPMYLGCLFCLFVYVEFFRICLQ
jgi:hypothetical protein